MTISQDRLEQQIKIEDDRTGLDIATLKRAIADSLFYLQGKSAKTATLNDYYLALAYTIRDRSIREYCEDIWNVEAVPVEVAEYAQTDTVFQTN